MTQLPALADERAPSFLPPGAHAVSARPIVLSAGDLLGPEPLSGYALEGPEEVQAQLLGLLTLPDGRPVFDAVLPGNFELSAPSAQLERLADRATVPWTVANVILEAEHRPHRVFVRSGARIGVTGVVDEALATSLAPSARTELLPAPAALDASAEVLRKAGVDTVVALIHLRRTDGLSRVVRILEALDGPPPDVVLTSPLDGDPVVARLAPSGTVVVAAPPRTLEASLIHLRYDARGHLADVEAKRYPILSVPSADADVVRNWVCSRLDEPLAADAAPDLSREVFLRWVLEEMRRSAGAEVAFLSRSSVGPDAAFPLGGQPTLLDVRRALPFDEGLEVAEIRGADLAPLEGLALDPRVASVGLGPGTVAGRPRDDLRAYRVVTVDFLAEGGDAILDPAAYPFAPLEGGRSLREIVVGALGGRPMTAIAAPAEPWGELALFDLRINFGASLKSVNVENRFAAEAPQLTRQNFLGLSGEFDLWLALDLPKHRFELNENTRVGFIREAPEPGADPETRENEDITVIELLYSGRLAGGTDRPWLPDAGATARLETELTIPEERAYRRALLEIGVGPSWVLAPNLTLRSQLGLRRELLASGRSPDPAEAALAEIRAAVLSTLELRDEVLRETVGPPVVLNLRVSHTADLTGQVRDQVVQGALAVDVPVIEGLALTAAVEVYILQRDREAGPPLSGAALDTTFGIRSFMDVSEAFFLR